MSPGLGPNLSLSVKATYNFSSLISRQVVGVLIWTPLLCLQDLLPTSTCRDILKHFKKHVVSGNQLTSYLHHMTLQPTCPREVKQKTSPRSRILKLFDALDRTLIVYQPSDHCRTLVQAQHRPNAEIQKLNTNDSSFTLHGVLSTLQQGLVETASRAACAQ